MADKILLKEHMMNRVIYTVLFLIALFMPAPSHASWLIYHKPAYHGKVIDAETKEPIEGAVIVVEYEKGSIGVPQAYYSIIEVKEALTDKNGEFHIPSYTTIIQPLSIEGWARFIIYKPGYGSFPNYQVSPPKVGINPEEFFSREKTGTEGEMEWKGIGKKFKVTFGVVELPKLQTREERVKAKPAPVGEKSDWKKQKQFIKAIREEWRYLYSEDPGDLYKIEEKSK